MRILSFILAVGFVFAAPNFSAAPGSHLPGPGAFTYPGSQPAMDGTVAHLTLTPRGKALPASTQGISREVASTVTRS